jgi:general secretion pathway protein A
MYLSFYGFREKPFNTTPDPRFLYLTRGHREALAQLTYGVQENRGFLLLTGEVGTGKTTLLRNLLQHLDTNTAAAFVFNSSLSFDGILEYILHDLRAPIRGDSRAQRLLSLNDFLIERRLAGQRTVLILDEAQNLDAPTLEHIRLLSNLETSHDKVLQILLIGQPELEAKLELPELRQLRQRIELRYRISPLSPDDTRAYIRARLRVAGTRNVALFSDAAVARIAAYSNGIPRRVNILCDHCLVIGYAEQRRSIEPDIVKQAIAALEPRAQRRTRRLHARQPRIRLAWMVTAFVAALVGGMAVVPLRFDSPQLVHFARAARELLGR